MTDAEYDSLCAQAAGTLVVFLLMFAVLAFVIVLFNPDNDMPNAYKRPGCPLDAIEYYSPAFTGNDSPCYLIEDRSSGARWWRVRMSDGWVVMPILEVEQ